MSDDKRYIDYYFCLNSPWVYLAQKRLKKSLRTIRRQSGISPLICVK